MKKSLVALAALAVVGAASAQVSLTGTVSFSYQNDFSSKAGLTQTDNSFNVADTEDLGGGTKLVMSTGFDGGGRGSASNGSTFGNENSSLTVSGGFGAVKVQAYESDGPFAAVEGLAGASLSTGFFDSNALNVGKRFRTGITYATPEFSGFTGALTYVQLAGTYASTDVLQDKTKIVPAVTYKNGPLTAYAEYAVFNPVYNSTATGYSADDQVTQPTVTATYDFGVATAGFGWTKASNAGSTVILAASVPVGAVTLGVATAQYNNNSGTNATWTEGSISYALSKRTALKASFAQVNDAAVANTNTASALAAGGTYGLTTGFAQNCEYRVGLFHSF